MSHAELIRTCVLLADSSSDMPVGTKVGALLLFGFWAVVSTGCLFVSKKTLSGLSAVIGTKNPLFARIVCLLGAVVGWGIVVAVVASFFMKA